MTKTVDLQNAVNQQSDAGLENTLQSAAVKQRLNQVDKIRAIGVGDHISLPQLVVCGAQSAGKSSVLEGITGIPFPRQDGVCTKFATEIILRHSLTETSITASIIPHKERDPEEANALRSFRRSLAGYGELPDVISDAAQRMGIRGFGNAGDDAPAFSADVLRIEAIGNTGLHLTVVDLPGLISVDETGGEDIRLVENLVDSYLRNSRTIILAVVRATNDIVTEPIIQRARDFDSSGERTVGIITKADLINRGTEDRIAKFTKNQDQTKLKLGYFVLKNPSPKEINEGMTLVQRKRAEMQFFQSTQWQEHRLNMSRVGIDALRSFLASLLETHIERELPKVCEEIETLLQRTQDEIRDLGKERSTIGEQRSFLSELSMEFHGLMQAALDGTYQNSKSNFFGYGENELPHSRLRAQYHYLNDVFANYMRERSQKRKIASSEPASEEASAEGMENKPQAGLYSHLEKSDEGPIFLSEDDFDSWVQTVHKQTRGQELPGSINNTLLTELFQEQSSRWKEIAERHVKRVLEVTFTCVGDALKYVVKEDSVRRKIGKIINRRLQEIFNEALEELGKLWADERLQPITYNHYFSDNIQKTRQQIMSETIENGLQDIEAFHIDYNSPVTIRGNILAVLQRHINVDMTKQACEEAKTSLHAYYKVDMKTFVDNVCRQVIERHIACKVRNVFTPADILKFSDEEVKRIASEPRNKEERRRELKDLEKILQESLEELTG